MQCEDSQWREARVWAYEDGREIVGELTVQAWNGMSESPAEEVNI